MKLRESYQNADIQVKSVNTTYRAKPGAHLLLYQKAAGARAASTTFQNTNRSKVQFDEEIKIKKDINYQLAINGFVRKHYITTQVDLANPITVENPNLKMYASLSEQKKYGML